MVEYLKAGFFYITIVSKWLSIEIEITVELFNIIHYYIIQHYSLLHSLQHLHFASLWPKKDPFFILWGP